MSFFPPECVDDVHDDEEEEEEWRRLAGWGVTSPLGEQRVTDGVEDLADLIKAQREPFPS